MREGTKNNVSEAEKGILLGVVLDLSDSMRTSIQNSNHDQLSRIESLSQAFRGAVGDENVLLQRMVEEKENEVDLPVLADKIKQLGIPIICCFITNRNIVRPRVLRNSPGLFWSEAAR